ncbi:MAG: enolase C-terminal domain-like protein [Minisyncoccia bacterium]|jgi:enolase
MKIKSLSARKILDSRGKWTVEVTLETKDDIRAVASAPQGKSTGSSEARAFPADKAVQNVNKLIAPWMRRNDFRDQVSLDAFLCELDGTPSKAKLGANATLPVSVAFARAMALAKHVPLWRLIRANMSGKDGVIKNGQLAHPRLFINVVNGGLHAGNNLDFQEYLIIPKCRTIAESVDIGVKLYHALGAALEKTKGRSAANLGDEGGFAPNFKNNAEPFQIIRSVAKKLHFEHKIDLGMDAAATDVKNASDKKLEAFYIKLVRDYGLMYIEDPFNEKDFLAFAALNLHFKGKTWIAGDDLTTTNVRNMKKAHAEESINAIIIKPNQIGTVTETLNAVHLARKYGWAVVTSHRSGETDDDFIADLAYGVRADGLKLGAPARGERIAKYNRLLEIESQES